MSATVYFTYDEAPRLHPQRPSSTEKSCSGTTLQYLNEGGANFVFRILAGEEGNTLPTYLQGQLLRLRKDLPNVPSTQEQLLAYRNHFQPLFPEDHLVQYMPIELADGITATINDALKDLKRPSRRQHDFLSEGELLGVLVTDMTPGPDDVLLQVKPKWLMQSRNAPADAQRCRTCALRAQRSSKKIRTATDAQETCPLGLVSTVDSDRRGAAQGVTENKALQEYLVNDAQPLLRMLRDNQQNLDRHGVLSTQQEDDVMDLCKAMTTRDCTLFLRLSGSTVEARLADLDLKLPEKLDRWKKVETDLIDHGWYTNRERKEFWKQETTCLLSRLSYGS